MVFWLQRFRVQEFQIEREIDLRRNHRFIERGVVVDGQRGLRSQSDNKMQRIVREQFFHVLFDYPGIELPDTFV